MTGRERPYLSYLLRLWLVEDGRLVWRASLEAPGRAERHGFTTLDDLVAFLRAETRDFAAEAAQEQSSERRKRREPRGANGRGRDLVPRILGAAS